jgi:hypothetical protein
MVVLVGQPDAIAVNGEILRPAQAERSAKAGATIQLLAAVEIRKNLAGDSGGTGRLKG